MQGAWKTPEDVSLVTFSTDERGELIRLGGNTRGNVYVGRMRFTDGSAHRVAIKRFHKNHRLSDEMAARYNTTISDLRESGVALPKMAAVKVKKGTHFGNLNLPDDEWMQVSQLFGSSKRKSKLRHLTPFNAPESPQAKRDSIEQLTRVANAGYWPAYDIVQPFKDREKGAVPIDIDIASFERRPTLTERAECLSDRILDWAGDARGDLSRLYLTAHTNATPELRQALEKQLGKPPD